MPHLEAVKPTLPLGSPSLAFLPLTSPFYRIKTLCRTPALRNSVDTASKLKILSEETADSACTTSKQERTNARLAFSTIAKTAPWHWQNAEQLRGTESFSKRAGSTSPKSHLPSVRQPRTSRRMPFGRLIKPG